MHEITLPNLPSLLALKGSEGGYYVYTYKNQWDPVKKRSKRVESKAVGKIVGGEKYGLVQFYDDFMAQYPELKLLITEKKGRNYIFTPIDKEKTILQNTSNKAKTKKKTATKNTSNKAETKKKTATKNTSNKVETKHAGATVALHQIAKKTLIPEILQKVFDQDNDDAKILSLAYFISINQSSSLHYYPEFSEITLLPYRKVMDLSIISKLFHSITEAQIDDFIEQMNHDYVREFAQADDNNTLFLLLDSTSSSTYSDQLALAEYGDTKDLDTLKQVNMLMLVNQNNGIPLFYRSYDGPVPNVVTIKNTIAQCTPLKLNENIVFVSDKDPYTANTINECLLNNVSFIFNTSVNTKNSFIQEEVDAAKSELLSCCNFIKSLNSNCVSKEITWHYDASPVAHKKKSNKNKAPLMLHMYFNEDIFNHHYKVIVNTTATAIEKLTDVQGDLNQLHPLYKDILDKYADFTYDEKRNHYNNACISAPKIENALKYVGIQVLITDKVNLTAVQCHQIYFERNKVEYAFNTLKSRLNCNSLRCCDNEALLGKSFVQFIATAISLQVRCQLKKFQGTIKSRELKGKALYECDSKILASLNNILAHIDDDDITFNEIEENKADFYQALGVDIPTSGDFSI